MRTSTHVTVAASAIGFVIPFMATSVLQLKPFNWNTYDVSQSLQEFDANRYILMTGMWLRAVLLIPATLFGVGMYQLLKDTSAAAAQAGLLFVLASGLLNAVSGWVGVVVGVPAEEYQPGAPSAHAVEVLADSLYWIQDNLITMSNITLATGVLIFSVVMLREGSWPRWAALAGILTLPLALVAAMSFYFQVGILFGRNLEAPVYLAGGLGAGLAFLVWITGVIGSCIRR